MLETTMGELLRVYEAMKKDLYTLLVSKSPHILDYEGKADRFDVTTKVATFRYRTNFKDTDDHIMSFKVQRYLEETVRHDLALWGETQQIEKLHIFSPFKDLYEEDFRMTVILRL